ncbi:MAG TPA: SBBP repeat-containing protein [Roseiflexaceae bacterium]|nr:SBBP repeat-containing protein [Roseiflexaceae bacterium]
MRTRLSCSLLLLAILLIAPVLPASSSASLRAQPATTAQADRPLMFVENIGQFAAGARFVLPGERMTVFLADDALWLTAVEQKQPTDNAERRGVSLRLSFVGANPHPRLEPFGRVSTVVSFLKGRSALQHSQVPVWSGIRYVDLYPSIDLELIGASGRLAPRLVARPGADLAAVGLRVDGGDRLSIAGDQLQLATSIGTLSLPLLETTMLDGARQARALSPAVRANEIQAPFASASARRAGPSPQAADNLIYSTFLGGSGTDFGAAIALDSTGSVYVAGNTLSINFPTTPGAFTLNACGCQDGFIAKFRPGEPSLIYATFLGGEDNENLTGIAVDGEGNSYVTGYTVSTTFPTTASPIGNNLEPANAFIAKLNSMGTELGYSRLIGGNGEDRGLAIGVDAQGAAYITGSTNSDNFITTLGDGFGGGMCSYTENQSDLRVCYDAFVTKLDPSGSALVYSRLLGGDGDENQHNRVGIAVDAAGVVYLTGSTSSYDQIPFPTTAGALQTDYGPDPSTGNRFNAFAVKLNSSGSIDYSSYIGGSSYDAGHDIAVDGDGAAYIVTKTSSADLLFPINSAPADPDYNGGWDAFIVKLDSTGSTANYATWLGGSEDECTRTCAIAVDQDGVAYIGGGTQSAQFPTTAGAYDQQFSGGNCDTGDCTDAFVVRLSASGATLEYGSFAGGTGDEDARDIAASGNGQVYITGYSDSFDFPTTADALYPSYDAEGDSFILALATLTTYTLSGSAQRVGGAPVVGVRISDNTGRITTTSSDGGFTLRGLAPGTYTVRAAKTGYRVAPAQQTISVPATTATQTFILEPGGAYLPLVVRSPAPPPQFEEPPCDAFESNNNRRVNPAGPLLAGQAIQAKICAFEGADTPLLGPEDNYWFETNSNAAVVLTVNLPDDLLAGESSSILVYAASNLDKPLANCYKSKIIGKPFVMTCPIPSAGKFVVRLYTNTKQSDDLNPYTLKVDYQ